MNLLKNILSRLITISIILSLSLLFGCSDNTTTISDNGNRYWEQAKELYEKARESGEKVPENIKEWIKEDIKKIGTWEYKIVLIDSKRSIEKELNELGKERWECFWIERKENGFSLFLKRPVKNYLKAIPAKHLLKLIS